MKRILIVDDEENARIGLSKLLKNAGYQVDAVRHGQEALTFLAQQAVDLVITDINMPVMDGIHFLREIHHLYPNIDVIMMTAYGGVESYLEAMNLGAFEYLNKPIRIDELKSIMDRLFSGRAMTA